MDLNIGNAKRMTTGHVHCLPYHPRSNAIVRSSEIHKIWNADVVENTSFTRRSNKTSPPVGVVPCAMIQVSPGEYMRLRGAKETWKAIQQDFYVPYTCICCHETLFCIQDTSYVVCPACNVVSPSQSDKLFLSHEYNGGVGLGFAMEELMKWQNEIVAARNQM